MSETYSSRQLPQPRQCTGLLSGGIRVPFGQLRGEERGLSVHVPPPFTPFH